MIAWPDHSTTRLGAQSRLTIIRMRVADDYSHIELVASLESGKIWSNIVRTLYPDSRIEFYLPKSGTVAGVRGTVFEINLENNYIHSVEHSVTLENSIGQLTTLLPGDAVQVNNIFSKIISGLDTAWISLNSLQDNTYMSLRNAQLRDTYTLLAGNVTIYTIWDNFVRWILGWFAPFQDIALIASINSGNLADMATMPQVLVMKWYQSLQSADFIQERDQFRGVIMSWKDNIQGDQLIDNLTKGAIWDMSTLS